MKGVFKRIKRIIDRKIYSGYFNFSNSKKYWEERYKIGKNSGSGSYGRLAEFKAEIINKFIEENGVQSAIEYGCGDGNQLALINYKNYIGVDVSEQAIRICEKKFRNDKTKTFLTTSHYKGEKADMTLSLDVIYHLVEDTVFEDYMNLLFQSSNNYVLIYSSNFETHLSEFNKHIKHRIFGEWIFENKQDFNLIQKIPNEYTYDGGDDTSFADFYIYQKKKN